MKKILPNRIYTYPQSSTDKNLKRGFFRLLFDENLSCLFVNFLLLFFISFGVVFSGWGQCAASGSVTNVSCFGGSNGSINITPSGGTGGYTFLWSNSNTGEDISGLIANTYTVVVSGTGCSTSEPIPFIVGQPTSALATLSGTQTNVSCKNGTNGTITLNNPTGGTPGYTYLWNDGNTDQNRTGLAAGTYTVTVSDFNNCKISTSFTITEPDLLTISETHLDVRCFGQPEGSITTTTAGGTLAYSYLWADGPTTPNRIGLVAGTYSVTVTDSKNCQAGLTYTIQEPALIVLSGSQVNILCKGASTGSINLSVAGGSGSFSYSWTNGAGTSEDPAGLAAGTYQVSVTDNNGCTIPKSLSFTLTEPLTNIATLSGTQTNVSCKNGTNGTITLNNPTGGTPGYTYLWNDGNTDQNRTGLAAGTYTVTVSDFNNCKISTSFTITEPDLLTISETHLDVRCFGQPEGSITTTTAGGTLAYSYLWADGPTTPNRIGLVAGTYSVTVTDSKNCQAGLTYTIQEPALIVLSGSQVNILCKGASTGSINLSVAGGSGSFSYSWTNGAGTSEDPAGLAAGTYQVSVTDNNGCTIPKSLSFTLTEPLTNIATLSGTQTNVSCKNGTNGTITLNNPTGGTPGYTYLWNDGNTDQNRTGLAAGTYTVTVSDFNNCKISTSFTITEPDLLTISETHLDVRCFGQPEGSITTTTAGGTLAYSYLWADGPTTPNRIGLVAGTYSVTVTDSKNCQAGLTYTIQEPALIVLSGSQVNILCKGASTGSINLSVAGGSGSFSYSWTNGAGTSEDPAGLAAGTYQVSVTDNNGCTIPKSLSFTLTEPLTNIATLSGTQTNVSCKNGTNGTITLNNPTGGTPGYTYLWNDGNTDQNRTGLAAGTYTVTVSDFNNCKISTSFTITEPDLLTISETHLDVRCFGQPEGSITTTTAGGTLAYSYLWADGPTTPNRIGLVAGTYSVTVTDSKNCQAGLTYTIQEPALIVLSGSQVNILCKGASTGSINLSLAGGSGSFSYSWTNGAGTSEDPAGLAAGTYQVSVTDNNGCTIPKSLSFTLTEPLTNIATLSGTQTNVSCKNGTNGTITLNNPTGGTPGYTYLWNDGNTDQNRTGLAAGTYTVTVSDFNNCKISTSFTITEPPVLTVSATPTNVLCFGESTGAIDITASGGTAPYTYLWNDGVTTDDRPNIPKGIYNLTVTDGNGCTAFLANDVPIIHSDNTAPVFTSCPGSNTGGVVEISVESSCQIVVPYTISATDNCSLATGYPQITNGGPAPNSILQVGSYDVIWIARDNNIDVNNGNGNEATCTFRIVVKDNVNPVITCPTPTNPYIAEAGLCTKTIDLKATAIDNCDIQSLTYSINGTPITMPHVFQVGTYTVLVTATDVWSNTAVCSYDIIVKDNITPLFKPFDPIIKDNDIGKCGSTVNINFPFNDCSPLNLLSYNIIQGLSGMNVSLTENNSVASYRYNLGISGEFPVTTTNIIIDVSDGSNIFTLNFTVKVNDVQKPNKPDIQPIFSACPVTPPDVYTNDNCTSEFILKGVPDKTFPIENLTNVPQTTIVTWIFTDAAGNTETQEQIIKISPMEIGEFQNNTTFCQDVTNVQLISPPVTNGNLNGSVTEQWQIDGNNIGNTINPSVLPAGGHILTYTYSINSSPSCFKSKNFPITIFALPQATIAYNTPFCKTGTATVTQTGQSSGTYSAIPSGLVINSTTGEINLGTSTPGTYTVNYEFSDANCSNSTSTTVVINALPDAYISKNDPVCFGNSAIFEVTGTPGSIVSYTLNNIAGGPITLNASGIGLVTIPNVTVEQTLKLVSITNPATSCPNTLDDFRTITINPLPEITFGTNGPFCEKSVSVNLLVIPSGGTWTGSSGISGNNFLPSTVGDGSYILNYLVTDGNNCSNNANTTVIVNAVTSSTFSQLGPYCEGGTVGLLPTTSNEGNNGTWNPAFINNASDAVYTFTPAAGCIATGTMNIDIVPTPNAQISLNPPVCYGRDAIFSVTGTAGAILTYKINSGADLFYTLTGGIDQLPPIPNVTTPQNLTLVSVETVSPIACSKSLGATSIITLNPLPENTITGFQGEIICEGQTGHITFDAFNSSFNIPYSIEISDGNSTWIVPISNNGSIQIPVSPTITTNYTLNYIENGNGCRNYNPTKKTATITIKPLPDASISGSSTVCVGSGNQIVTLTGQNSSPPYKFTYNINGGANLTVQSSSGSNALISQSTTAPGTFIYNLVGVEYVNGEICPNIINNKSITIVVEPQPIGPTLNTITPNSAICKGNTVSATFNSGSGGVGCSDDFILIIDGGSPVPYSPGTSVGSNANTSIIIQGRRANCSDASCNGTSYVTLASWVVNQKPVLNSPGLSSLCTPNNSSVNITSSTPISGTTITWYATNADGLISGYSNQLTPVSMPATINQSGLVNNGTAIGTVVVHVIPTANGCIGDEMTYNIDVYPRPIGSATNPNPICSGETFSTALNSNLSITTLYTWTAANLIGNASGFSDNNTKTSGPISQILINNSGTTATVRYTVTPYSDLPSGLFCAGNDFTFDVVVNPIPNVSITPVLPICFGNSTTLTASGASSFSWDTGETTNSILVSPTTITTYSVTGTTNGCSNMASVTVNVNPRLTPSITCGIPTLNTVIFNWNPVSGATGYTASYTVNGTLVGNNISLGNVTSYPIPVSPGDDVVLTLLPNDGGGNGCFGPTTSEPCSALDCVPPNAGTDGSLTVCSGVTPSNSDLFNALQGTPDVGGVWSQVGNVYTYTVSTTAPCLLSDQSIVLLTIVPSTFNTTTLSACDTYTWANNGQTYTSSGTYTGTTTNCVTERLVLTIVPSTFNTTTLSACDTYTWANNGQTYTSSGTYTGTTTNCVTERLVLTIVPSTFNTTTLSACDTYTWANTGLTYNTSGTYTGTTTNCVTERLVLTIVPSTFNTTTLSACDTYTWANTGLTYNTSGTYTGTTTNCVTERLVLTIVPSTFNTTTLSACDTYTWANNGQTYTSSGTYTGTTTNCVTERLVLTIVPSTFNTTTLSACDTYTWANNGQTYTSSGTYTGTTTNCVTERLVLTIVPSTFNTTTLSACDTYTWANTGLTYNTSGTYTGTTTNCVTERLVLTIVPSTFNTTTLSACDTYTWANNGQTYTSSGTYTGTTTNCVTEILVLTIVPSTFNTTTLSACDTYTWANTGLTYNTSGTYTGTTTNCVTERLVLTIVPSTFNTTTLSACDTYTWANNGQTYTSSGTYTGTTTNCVTERLVLTIVPSTFNTTTLSACDTYTWANNGQTYTSSGTYTGTTTNCVTERLVLTIVPSTFNTTTLSACDTYTWANNGQTYTSSGTYTGTTTNCVTERLVLTIVPSTFNTTTLSACDTYTWANNGQTYTSSGTYTGTTTNCVTERLVLTIVPSTFNTTTLSACDTYTWANNGQTYTSSGTYTGTTTNCVTERLVLTIVPSTFNTTTLSACDTYTWANNGQTYTSSGTYTGTTTNCVTERLVLTIVPSTFNTTTLSACDTYTWANNGQTYTSSGTYTGTTTNCVTERLVLTIVPSTFNTTTLSACDTYTWANNGQTYTSSGTYTGTTTNCVTERLVLTIVPSTFNTTTLSACDTYTWANNGQTYTSSGTYTGTTTNCVTERLVLTIVPSTFNTTTLSACDTYTWANNGQTYTSSGTYTGTTTNCVTERLVLTIVPSTFNTTTLSACDTYTWANNGQTYTSSGTYTGTTTNCVTERLVLTIVPSTFNTTTLSACDTYTWANNGQTYTSSGTYTGTTTNCVTERLVLTIVPSTFNTTTLSACDTYTWANNGQTYTSSGTYTGTTTNCVTERLVLTIVPSTFNTTTLSACDTYTWANNGQTYTSSGTYTGTTTNCVTERLVLTIVPSTFNTTTLSACDTYTWANNGQTYTSSGTYTGTTTNCVTERLVLTIVPSTFNTTTLSACDTYTWANTGLTYNTSGTYTGTTTNCVTERLVLTIVPSTFNTTTLSACDTYTWANNGQTYTSSGTYTGTTTNCVTERLVLTIVPSTFNTTTLSACDTYTWANNGQTYTSSGTYTGTTTNCVTERLVLTIVPSTFNTTTLSACDTYTWANNGQTYTSSGTYTGTTTNCVTERLVLTIVPSTFNTTTLSACDTYTWANNGQTYTSSGTYTGTTTNCVTERLVLTIVPSTFNTTTLSACDTYTWANTGLTYNTSGTYTGTTTNCVTERLVLTIVPSTFNTTTLSACDTYTWANTGLTYNTSGTYTGTTTNCVTERLVLTIVPSTFNTTTLSACDTYTWANNGQTYTSSGTYTGTTTNCVTERLVLTIVPSTFNTTTLSACDTYTWANTGLTYNTSGTYTGTTTNCVTERLVLTIVPSTFNTTTLSACDTYTWANNGQTYTSSGTYTGTTTNCVTERLVLTIVPSTFNTTTLSACDTYTWANNGQTYTSSGTYTGTTTNCVTERLVLTIVPSTFNTTTLSACDTYTWANNGQTYTSSGTYTGTTTNCVTERLVLTIVPSTFNTTTLSACDTYTWANNGQTYTSSGTYTGTTTNCVTERLVLTIVPSTFNTTTLSACDTYTWANTGLTYNTSGTYTGTTTNCVTERLVLTIVPSTFNTTTLSACDTYTWANTGLTYNTSGTYTGTTTNCVTERLVLTIVPSTFNTTTLSACDTYTWANNGQTYTSSGTYTGTTTNCVTERLVLTIVPSTFNTTTLSACDTYTWANNGQTYTSSGTYTGTTTNCVTERLVLTIVPSTFNTTTLSACDTYTWANTGLTYNTSGTYTGTTTNCVTERLVLTIVPSTFNTTTLSACDTYTWANNGQTYTSSGTYTGTTTNCVTERLVLTIVPSTFNTTTLSACDTYTWANNGQTYTSSGTYTGTTTNCVTERLVLTIVPSTFNTTTLSACDTYTWANNGQTYTSSGTYTGTTTNCVTERLVLTIVPSTFNTTTLSACDTYTWANNGQTYTSSGTYTGTTTNCVTERLVLTIVPSTFNTTTLSACDTYTWANNGQTYTSSGTYTGTTTNCVTERLVLTIVPSTFNTTTLSACDTYTWANNGQTYTSSGTYTGTTTNCVTERLVLTIVPSTFNTTTLSACDTYTWANNGQTYTSSGTYTGTTTNCVTERLVLTIVPSTFNTTTLSACDTYTWANNGQTYTSSGTYTGTTTNCVTERLVLTIVPSTFNTTTLSACDTYTWANNGQTYTSSGTYTGTTTNCVTERLVLTIVPSTFNTTTLSACDTYTWANNGQTYTSSGTYTGTTTNCVTERLVLTIVPSTFNTTTLSACDTYTWANNGQTYTSSGTYTGTTTNCLTERLVLTIVPSTFNTTTLSACDTYTWANNGQTYTSSGTYTGTTTNCVTERLVLTIVPSTFNTTTLSACDTYTWANNGQTYTSSGTYTGTTTNCVTERLVLTIVPSTFNTTTLSACDTYTWANNGQTYTSSGTYTGTTTNCVTERLVLTIVPSTFNTTTLSACDTYTWANNGQTYTTSGTYTGTTTNCVTERLVLTIVPSTFNTTTLSACDTYTWANNGQTYTTSGTYTGTTTNCVTERLVLTITPIPTISTSKTDPTCLIATGSITVTSLSTGLNYSINGVDYSNITGIFNNLSPNTYSVTAKNASGCVSAPVPVIIPAAPGSIAAPTVSVTDNCDGTSTINTNALGALLWSTGENTATITVNAAGIYSVVATLNGCVSLPGFGTASPKVKPSAPTISAVNNCDGTSVLTATNFTGTLLWSTNEITDKITVNSAGTYSVSQTVNGCTSNLASEIITIKPALVAPSKIDAPAACNTGVGTVNLSATGGVGPFTFTSLPITTINNNVLTGAPGKYNLTVKDNAGCTAQFEVEISAPTALLVSSIVKDALCKGGNGQATLSASGGNNIYTYTSTGGVINGNILTASASTYTVTATDGSGCTGTKSVTISEPSPVVASAVLVTLSFNGGDGLASLSATGGVGNYTFTSNGGTINGNILKAPVGTYTITATDAKGCTGVTSVTVSEKTNGISTNPDMNATLIDVVVTGNLATNDLVASVIKYDNPVSRQGNPNSNLPVVNIDGTYTFQSSIPGVYSFKIRVCEPAPSTDCTEELLFITVLDPNSNQIPPIVDVDLETAFENKTLQINTLANDKAGMPSTSILPNTITFVDMNGIQSGNSTKGGTGNVNISNGVISYTPPANITGTDTLKYIVCDNQSLPKCASAYQVIRVLKTNNKSTTIGADDFNKVEFNNTAKGNVKENDTDASGSTQTITPQSVNIPNKGKFELNADGTYTFVPVLGFFGPIEFAYQVCNTASTIACANATVHILVMPPKIKTNPDVYVTFVNEPVKDDLSKNDIVSSGTTYSNPVALVGNPNNAMPVVNADGTFTFVSSVDGDYVFDVKVCAMAPSTLCVTEKLSITVLKKTVTTNPPIANNDYVTTPYDTPTSPPIPTLANDLAGQPGNVLVPSSITLIDLNGTDAGISKHGGSASVDMVTGDIIYFPKAGFEGVDSLQYSVCDNQVPAKCATAYQIITVQECIPRPTNLILISNTATQIRMRYTDNSYNELGFEIQWSKDGVVWEPYGQRTTENTTTLIFNGFTPETKYYFRVRAVGPTCFSKFTEIGVLTTLPPAPIELTAKGVKVTQIDLAWKNTSVTATGIEFQRAVTSGATSDSSFVLVKTIKTVPNTDQMKELIGTTNYRFRIRYNSPSGNSAWSNIADASTLTITGNESEISENNVMIYPIPADKYLFIKPSININGKIQMRLINEVGVEVVRKNVTHFIKNQVESIEIDKLKFGVYFLEITTAKGTLLKKVFKQ